MVVIFLFSVSYLKRKEKMANLEEDMRLGDLSSEMPEHTGRLEGAMPYTLVLFALAAFAALILWIIYATMAGANIDNGQTLVQKIINANAEDMSQDENNWLKNSYREQMGFEGAVIGFLVIISYACVYGAMKIAHHRK